ncbi:hypothetical protein EVJ58_g836 [Rhodofomes roseus]|uniref:Rapamycin-insensitive companion of mTOR N-terminal domain-containing protein n=1 Tax=Rhodofomes roseus TaxID=34475 RepID=A0A4Y9Z1P0_9APHY|nr:hypothetical protein EVJ58_g836 [Rhodofomes roseus]
MPTVVVDHTSSSGSTQRLGDAGTSAYTNLTGTTLANGGSSFLAHSNTNGDGRGLDASGEPIVPDQFENLHNELKIANAIKDGAENMLQMPLTDALRMQVESELEAAKNKISAITSTIDTLLQRNLRVRYELDVDEVVKAVLPSLSDRSSKRSRATAYRLIRHSLVDFHSVERLKEQKLDWFLVKSLLRDSKYAVEKEQVIKLIRAIVEIGSEKRRPGAANARGAGAVPLSSAVMRALIAVAESLDDPFRLICLQTLTEILVIDIELMAKTGGIRCLLHALADGPPEISPLLASAFLHIVDCPSTRGYLRPGIDLEMALSGVTDAYGKGSEHVDRMRACTRVVTSMLRTWSGLMYFCIQDKLAIRSLIDGLRIPSLETREVILDMFFDLLNIRAPDWHQAFIAGRRLTIYGKSATSDQKELPPLPEQAQRPQVTVKLIDHFLGLLIQVLCGAGLLDALTCMLEESPVGSNLSRKAVLLMAEILQMSNRVLPLSIAAQIQVAIPLN